LTDFDRRLFLPRIFSGTASGQFLRPAASRLLLSRFLPNGTGPSHKAPARFGSSGLSAGRPELAHSGIRRKMGREKRERLMSYLNSVTIIGFVGADPEQLFVGARSKSDKREQQRGKFPGLSPTWKGSHW